MNIDNYSLRIQYIVNNKLNLIANNSNILGMGYGFKYINGIQSNIPSLTFLVRRKVSKASLHPTQIIPKYFNGVVTDVIESGDFKECAREKPVRPIVGGLSIQNPANDYWGTAGYAVTESETKENLYLLAAGHVLRSNNVADRIYIIQPKYQPGEAMGSRDKEKLGKLYIVNKIIPAHNRDFPLPSEYNLYDVCLIALGQNTPNNIKTLLAPGFFDKTKASGVVPVNKDGIVDLQPSAISPPSVTMYGCASGKQEGGLLLNPYTHKGIFTKGDLKDKVAYFKNQLAVKIKADYGDSGALGIASAYKRAFGMLMTITDANPEINLGIFNPLAPILSNYEMSLLP